MQRQVGIACDDSVFRECLLEVLRRLGHPVFSTERTIDPSALGEREIGALVVNHDHRTFDVFRWEVTTTQGESRYPIIALFEGTDREQAAAASRSLPLYACLIKPVPNDVIALTVSRALERTSPLGAEPSNPGPTISRVGDDDFRRDVMRAFV